MDKILLVEDSEDNHLIVSKTLGQMADLVWAPTVAKARELLNSHDFQLALIDVELPDGNGIELCCEVQGLYPKLSIFILTAHQDLSNKVLGFSAGADDYITKPFAPLELKARVEARLRKIQNQKNNQATLKWPGFEVDKNKQEVKIEENGDWENIALTSLEFKLLIYFSDRIQHVIAREKILDDIWGKDVHVYPRSVDTHVSKLRKKLLSKGATIESIHGTGYKFDPLK